MPSAFELHEHLQRRMQERGITREEIERTLAEGEPATDAKVGTAGKTLVIPGPHRRGEKVYAEKEVTVYYKAQGNEWVVLTAKARYGQGFVKEQPA